jgi:DNA-directed RNA polymerase specialized sigma subunit
MWTLLEQDEAVIRAEDSVIDTLSDFFMAYYQGRLPSAEEISAQLGVSPEEVIAAMEFEDEEEV